MLGHYRLLSRLGRGGMSEVYLAYDYRMKRQVAIKVVSASYNDYLERFHREAEAILTLQHPHILPAFDYGEEGPWHYLVMLHAKNGTLSKRLASLTTQVPASGNSVTRRFRRGRLSLTEAGIVLEQVASALQYAHDSGVIHRDIKPSNILMRDNRYVYLADFGLVKSIEDASGLTQTGSLLGTPEYMAPELAEGSANTYSDIYSLGILLYQMVTGRVPFSGETPVATYWKHLREMPVPPSYYNRAIPRSIELVILRTLEKDPRRRFQTPQALAAAYQQALRNPTYYTQEREGIATAFDLAEGAAAPPTPVLPPLTPRRPQRLVLPGRRKVSRTPVHPADPAVPIEAINMIDPVLTPAAPVESTTEGEPYTPALPGSQAASDIPLSQTAQPRTRSRPTRGPTTRRRHWYRNPVLVTACVGVGFLLIISILMSFVYVNYVSQQEVVATATARAIATHVASSVQGTAQTQAYATATAGVLSNATSGTPILTDNLVGNTAGRWPENANCQFLGGSYQVSIQQAGFLQSCISPSVTVTNAVIQTDVTLISGNDAGLIVRANGQQFYDFEITNQGEFFFRRHDGASVGYTYLINDTKSAAIAPNNANTLTIIANGHDFKLYINGTFVGEVQDANYSSGQVGFATGTLASNSNGDSTFTNLKIFKI